MSGSHLDNVVRVITAEMVTAGLPEETASTMAALAYGRVLAGETSATVIRELVERHKPTPSEVQPVRPEPTASEPMHIRMAREAGKTTVAARSAEDRIAAVISSGNPWVTGNVTHQALVRGLDPNRATKLQREAGR